MLKFKITEISALKTYLYNTYVHDANMKIIICDTECKLITIEIENHIFNYRAKFVFDGVNSVIFTKSNEYVASSKILSLTIENDYSFFVKLLNKSNDFFCDSIYVMFQMFSGDEIHILCKNVMIESIG